MEYTINIKSMKRLVAYSPNIIKHFCRSAGRLHGLIALREQLNVVHVTGRYETFEQVEMDMETLKVDIARAAILCARTLANLNRQAEKNRIPIVCYGLSEMSMSQVIIAVNDYVDELVAQSDFENWVDELAREGKSACA